MECRNYQIRMQDTQKLFQLVQSTATAETLNPVALVCLRFQLPKNEAQGYALFFVVTVGKHMSYFRSRHVNLGSEADWRNPKLGRWSQMRNATYVGIRAADKFRVYQGQTKVGLCSLSFATTPFGPTYKASHNGSINYSSKEKISDNIG